jgi:hypothetical protein
MGVGNFNRLVVELVQEEENKIICIARTDDSTGKTLDRGRDGEEDLGHQGDSRKGLRSRIRHYSKELTP